MATATLSHRAAAPVASLRALNPYIGSTLGEWTSKGLQAAVPRQLSPGATLRPDLSVGAALSPNFNPWMPSIGCLLFGANFRYTHPGKRSGAQGVVGGHEANTLL